MLPQSLELPPLELPQLLDRPGVRGHGDLASGKSRNQRPNGRAALLDPIRAARRSSAYSRSRSRATSDVVVKEGLYTCGMTVANALGKRAVGSYGRLPSAAAGGTIRTNRLVCLMCAATEEKQTMIGPEMLCASGEPRSVHAQSWPKRIMVMLATLLLATGLGFAGASTATAAPVLTNSQETEPPCRGNKPGICPNSLTTQSNPQESVPQSNYQSTTESDEQPATNRSSSF